MKEKFSTLRKGIFSILFWSVISAAFIGPGTVTTAAKAGASYGFSLLWALLFSTFTCLLLQEAAARVSIVTGRNIGQALITAAATAKKRFGIIVLVAGAIILGSAAYEAGNILGAVSGLRLLFPWPPWVFTLIIGGIAAAALFFSKTETLAKVLGFMVVVMGLSFITTAWFIKPDLSALTSGLLIPRVPEGVGAGMLILGLIGTTVVPYNLFLGSGIARKAEGVKMMRFGLAVSILLGGLISMAVLIVGSSVTGEFSFAAVSRALASDLGQGRSLIFAIGLAAAGLSSAITAPLASSITAWSVSGDSPFWRKGGKGFTLVWAGVLLTGIVFGITGIKPVPVIILAQALNGLILPFIAIALLYVVNNPKIMSKEYINSRIQNFLMGFVVLITIVLGLTSLFRSVFQMTGVTVFSDEQVLFVTLFCAFLITLFVSVKIRNIRNN
jgi:manganese transport protein